MIVVLGILQFLIILIVCIYELRKKSVAVFLWAILLVMFGMMHLLAIITNSYLFSNETMNQASIFVILFSSIYILTRKFLDKNTIKTQKTVKDTEENKQMMYILFILLVIVIIFRLGTLIKTAGSISNTSWETMRVTVTEANYLSFSQIFLSIFFVASSCIIFAIELKNKKILIASICLILLEVIISRNRIEIMPLLVTIIYAYINKKEKINIKMILTLAVIGVLSIYLIYGIRVFRRSGNIGNFFEQYDMKTFNNQIGEYLAEDDGELGLRNYFYYFIENDNKFTNFNKGHTYIRMMMVLIPYKFSFGLKPNDFAISMGTAVNETIEGLSIHPTLFGDIYANFGIIGILMGIFWAVYVICINKMCNNNNFTKKSVYSVIWGVCLVIQGRGSVYNAFASAIYSLIIFQVLYIIFKIIKNTTIKNKSKEE